MSNLLIAVNRVMTSKPDAPLEHAGTYDKDGNPILKRALLTILPGSFFEPRDAADTEYLLSVEAARYPSEAELAAHQRITAAATPDADDFGGS